MGVHPHFVRLTQLDLQHMHEMASKRMDAITEALKQVNIWGDLFSPFPIPPPPNHQKVSSKSLSMCKEKKQKLMFNF